MFSIIPEFSPIKLGRVTGVMAVMAVTEATTVIVQTAVMSVVVVMAGTKDGGDSGDSAAASDKLSRGDEFLLNVQAHEPCFEMWWCHCADFRLTKYDQNVAPLPFD